MLVQHCTNVIQMVCIYWDNYIGHSSIFTHVWAHVCIVYGYNGAGRKMAIYAPHLSFERIYLLYTVKSIYQSTGGCYIP